MLFPCSSAWAWCCALRSSLAFLDELDATLHALPSRFYMNLKLRSMIFTCTSRWTCFFTCVSTWTWCYASCSSLPFLHELETTLHDLHLPFYMDLRLRSMVFTWVSTWTCCGCLRSSLVATLHALPLQFCMNLMLRSEIFTCFSTWTWCSALRYFICVSTWTWCCALWSSLEV